VLYQKIENDFKEALLKRDAFLVSTLRLLRAAIFNKEKEKRYKILQELPKEKWEELKKESPQSKELDRKSQLSDEEIIEIINSEIKKRREAILQYEKGQRKDLAEKERREILILKNYLPPPLSDQEIEEMAKKIILEKEAKGMKDFGKVMKEIMSSLKGRVDGEKVAKIVKKLLS
jgi:uncharacterized protein YqeY